MLTQTTSKDITISPVDETFIKVECAEVHMEMELSDRFSFKVPGAQHDPRYKRGHWDGIKRLYNRQYKRIYKGLLFEVLKFAAKHGYTVNLHPTLSLTTAIERDALESIVHDFIKPHSNGNPIEPYPYQLDAVDHMLNSNRSICLAATSAGKSLMLYLAARLYQLSDSMDGKHIFIVVPSKSLVEQLYSDFVDYSTFKDSKWNAVSFVQRVSGDYDKRLSKQIVITTWQSLKDIPSYHLADAGAIFVDETHTVNGPILTKLMETAVNCPIRHGLTGTLDGFECNELAAQGLLGPCKRIITAKELIEQGKATQVKVACVVIDYNPETKKAYAAKQMKLLTSDAKAQGSALYQSEIEFINELKCRFNFIQKFVKNLKGNSIVLFDRVEGYGLPLYESMKLIHPNCHLIIGDVDATERERIRLLLETQTDAIVFATSRIMSTGVNIKNLHNIVTTSSNQSQIQTLQTIGRLMRLHQSKETAVIYDLVDKLDYNNKPNYTLKHVESRLAYYQREGHPVKFISILLNESLPDSIIVK